MQASTEPVNSSLDRRFPYANVRPKPVLTPDDRGVDALFGIVDVLSIVDHRGPSTIDELESAAPPDAGLWIVLDTCVDSGWLDARGWGNGSLEDSRYCLTPMGRRILEVSARCVLAA